MRILVPGVKPDRRAVVGLGLAELFPIGKRIGQVVVRKRVAKVNGVRLSAWEASFCPVGFMISPRR
jgi:hypothetical protein